MRKKPITISDEQLAVFERMDDGKNLFITGNAGTGKSTLLRHFLLNTKRKCVVLAPTGVAAMNVGGSTIHSFFKLSFGFLGYSQPKTMRNARGLKQLDTIIIDEISMVRADILDMIDKTLKHNLKSKLPFGGLQVIFLGDLLQLPPVVHQEEYHMFDELYGGYYFFHAPVFHQAEIQTIELQEVFRQTDKKFLTILAAMRNKALTPDQLSTLNQQVSYSPPDAHDEHIVLTARNFEADTINQSNLNKLRGSTKVYKAIITGDFKENDAPSPPILKLKVGARIMITKNDASEEKAYVNGALGTVLELKTSTAIVDVEGKEIELSAETWEQTRYEFDGTKDEWNSVVIGNYKQLPLKLAWAITIHKSQGKTFEQVYIDLGSHAFAHGQTYVALSRCTSLEGVQMKRQLRNSDIIIDPQVSEFLSR